MSNVSYEDFKGITKDEAKGNVSFSFELEKAISDVTGLGVNRKAVFRTDGGDSGDQKILLGLVPEDRPVVSYGEVTDWVCDELDRTGVDYKILDSRIFGKNQSMQQRYLLDASIGNPDGYNLSPMLVVNSSYTGAPLTLEMGTYRFVCSNGAIVGGTTFERTKISSRRLKDFGNLTVGDVIHRGLTRVAALADWYTELDQRDWQSYYLNFLNSEKVDVEFKKALTKYLFSEGTTSPLTERNLKNEDFFSAYLKGDTIYCDDKEPVIQIVTAKTKSAWDLYNDATYLASHETSTLLIRNRVDHQIYNIFAA